MGNERAEYGKATAKGSGGGDPNVLKLVDSNRLRLVEPVGPVRWRQHAIRGDENDQYRSVVCPKGFDGREQQPCPLCAKPVDEDGNERFQVSRRFALNVYDYTSESLKILIGGPQIFSEFDTASAIGMDPTSTDWVIHKVGTGSQTSYKVIRGDSTPLPTSLSLDQLHDLDKFCKPDSQEQIFAKLEEMGIDYDSLQNPSFTVAEAEEFMMPYGKHKGMTIETMIANERDYVDYIYNAKRDQGQFGDPVFIAMHTILENRGEADQLDTPDTPVAPASAATHGVVALIDLDGNLTEVPMAVKATLMQAGFTEPEPEPDSAPEPNDGMVTMIPPDGGEVVSVPADAVAAMEAAKFIIQNGQAQVNDPTEPEAPKLPADDDEVMVKLNAIPNSVPVTFKDAKVIVQNGQGQFVDDDIKAAISADNDDDQVVRQEVAAQAEQFDPPSHNPLDPELIVSNDDGTFGHPALDKQDYKNKGGVTQALNRIQNGGDQTKTNGDGEHGTVLSECKSLLADMPEIQSDFSQLLALFSEVAGKQNISDFTTAELVALRERLQADLAAKVVSS